MRLPDDVLKAIAADGCAAPAVTARALYDVDGGLGECYLAADDRSLWIFSRGLDRELTEVRLALDAIRRMEVRGQTVFCYLEFKTAKREYLLKFSAWDHPQIERLAALWSAARGEPAPAAVPATAPVAVEPETPSASALEWFCAGIHLMINCDDHVDLLELNYLARQVGQAAPVERGHALAREQDPAALLARLAGELTTDQRRCLYANLAAVAMQDGLLRPAELELLDRFQETLEIDQATRDRLYRALLQQHQVAVLAEPGGETENDDGLTPLIAFCAALHAMMAVDQSFSGEEQEVLQRLVGNEQVVQAGVSYLQAHDLEFLLARLPSVMNPAQRGCLMNNLVGLAMVDGELNGAEQVLLERYRQALEIAEDDYREMYEILLLKNNLTVFA